MLRSIVVLAARWTPSFIKRWVHKNRLVDHVSRKIFSGAIGVDGSVIQIQSGPLTGIKLVVTEHISHAHISGTYELETQRAIDRLISSGFVCYDLGASIGYLSLLMARKTRQVYSFEPAPHAAEQLRKHAAANDLNNIEIVPSPVSDCERIVEFALTDNAYGSSIVGSTSKWPTLKLTTITLDDFAVTHPLPNFIKMDVEGEEGRVFQGARRILREKKPLICCELHSEEAAREVQEILTEYGYTITTLDGRPFEISGPIIPGDVQIIAIPES
jgi:FkbM family methyltransferase